MKRCAAQHKTRNLVRTARGKMHRTRPTEGMPEHHYPWLHLVEYGGNCFGVVRTSPYCVGRGSASEPGQVKCDRVDSRGARTASKSLWSRRHPCRARTHGRARAVRLTEQA